MKGQITVIFSAKEAVALLSSDTLPKSLTNKIVKAFKESATVQPQGAKASVVSRATKPVKTTKAKATKTDKDEYTQQPVQ